MNAQKDKTKVVLIAPLVFLPFMALLFWSMGGGTAAAENKKAGELATINTTLPGAAIHKGADDKLSLYDQADRDSAKMAQLREVEAKDWHLRAGSDSSAVLQATRPIDFGPTGVNEPNRPEVTPDALERRLASLQQQLAAAQTAPGPQPAATPALSAAPATQAEQVEKMMDSLASSNTNDPEITQLNQLLDKVIAIQHPGSAADSMQARRSRDSVHLATSGGKAHVRASANQFYGFATPPADTIAKNTITAAVYQDQVAVTNANVKLMLMEDMQVAGYRIAKGTFITGHANIYSGRLHLSINNIIVGKTILQVSLAVFDTDGEEGINAPNSALRDQSKQSSDVLNDVGGLSSYDPSLGAQATAAGIQTARSFLTKRIKVAKVPLYAGYQVLLKNTK